MINLVFGETTVSTPSTVTYMVPSDGKIRATVKGARGGNNGGSGASITGVFTVVAGDELTVEVGSGGGQGGTGSASNGGNGGGYSSVSIGETKLIVAGGGGGSGGGGVAGGGNAGSDITTNLMSGENGQEGRAIGSGGGGSGGSAKAGLGGGGGGSIGLNMAGGSGGSGEFAGGGGGGGWSGGGGGGAGQTPGIGGGGGGGSSYYEEDLVTSIETSYTNEDSSVTLLFYADRVLSDNNIINDERPFVQYSVPSAGTVDAYLWGAGGGNRGGRGGFISGTFRVNVGDIITGVVSEGGKRALGATGGKGGRSFYSADADGGNGGDGTEGGGGGGGGLTFLYSVAGGFNGTKGTREDGNIITIVAGGGGGGSYDVSGGDGGVFRGTSTQFHIAVGTAGGGDGGGSGGSDSSENTKQGGNGGRYGGGGGGSSIGGGGSDGGGGAGGSGGGGAVSISSVASAPTNTIPPISTNIGVGGGPGDDGGPGYIVLIYKADLVCYAKGTKILTQNGYVKIEDIKASDLVVTTSTIKNDRTTSKQSLQAIKQKTHFTVKTSSNKSRPICIKAHTFGQNMPFEDLFVSPGHGIQVKDKLVRARNLINGKTITQSKKTEDVTYYHIELAKHAMVVANGIAAESYLERQKNKTCVTAFGK